MRSFPTPIAALLLALVPFAAHAQPNDAPLATRQNFFTIPFTAPAVGSGQPLEVQLYVSADLGRSWQLYGRENPAAGKFDFRAQRDGEYWFASRTVSSPAPPQQQAYRPELRVLIDTISPQIELTANVGLSGEVQTSWHVADPNLLLDTFKVYFRHAATDQWQPVAVELPQGQGRTELSGTTTWWPQRHGTGLEVRAEVQDRAGNTNVVQRAIQLPNIAGNDRHLAAADVTPPGNSNPVQWPADQVIGQDAPQQRDAQRPIARDQAPARPQAAEIQEEFAHRAIAPFELPPGERPEMTKHRRFNLDYDIDGVGPSGIASVELWATRDGGRLWERWGVDEDRRSPFPIEIEEEGIYGFRIVAQSGNGLTGHAPRSGDPAEVWIGLDETPPQATITSARYGRGQEVGTLSIFWEATDDAFDARPITLLFSDNPRGPWTALAAGLPNDGRYDWQVDGRVPAQIYLRLEARDEAGNLAIHQLDRPIANDGLIPRGRIRGIQPIEESPREASRAWPRW